MYIGRRRIEIPFPTPVMNLNSISVVTLGLKRLAPIAPIMEKTHATIAVGRRPNVSASTPAKSMEIASLNVAIALVISCWVEESSSVV